MAFTQMLAAKSGIITPAMIQVAKAERLQPEEIRAMTAAGTVVIPANIRHTGLQPCGIGRKLLTKINANIGNSSTSSCPRSEQDKLAAALKYGADTIMDLSTGSNIMQIPPEQFAPGKETYPTVAPAVFSWYNQPNTKQEAIPCRIPGNN